MVEKLVLPGTSTGEPPTQGLKTCGEGLSRYDLADERLSMSVCTLDCPVGQEPHSVGVLLQETQLWPAQHAYPFYCVF